MCAAVAAAARAAASCPSSGVPSRSKEALEESEEGVGSERGRRGRVGEGIWKQMHRDYENGGFNINAKEYCCQVYLSGKEERKDTHTDCIFSLPLHLCLSTLKMSISLYAASSVPRVPPRPPPPSLSGPRGGDWQHLGISSPSPPFLASLVLESELKRGKENIGTRKDVK